MPALVTGITAVLTAFKATAIGTWLTGTFTGRLLASVALSALQAALVPKPSDAGFSGQYTATGGTNPCSFIVGFAATAGQEICPPMTHGKAGKTPNAYLTYVIKLGDIPGQSLQGMQIDGAPVTLGATAHPDYGLPVTGRYNGYAWFKYYNGTQTVADPMLLAKYGSYPERPWLSDMVGTNMCYVIMTFRYNQELFGGLPQGLWECGGIPLYDPRKDTTVGGSGTHRWANVATWERSLNNAVINYNFARGVTLPSLGVWGGDFAAEDLPLATWFTAMNECDVLVDSPATPQFQAGYEVRVSMEPAGVMEEVGKACTGQFAEAGGILKMRVGGPGLPVLFITDGDIIVSKPQDYQPFPNAASRQNGIEARFPDPAQVWQPIAAPPQFNTTWEAEDGARRVANIDFLACPYPKQVYRVMKSFITDARRNRSHGLTLPPDAAILEPLDVISWTSTANTYTAKLFEVSQVADDLLTILQRLSIREVDPADFVPPTGLVLPGAVSSAPAIPVAQTLPGWAVSGYIIADGASVARAPGGIGIWDGAELDDATGVQYQVRVFLTGQVIEEGFVSNVLAGRVVASKGILRKTGYEMRALLVVEGRASSWTAWTYFLSPDIASVGAAEIGLGAVNLGNMVGGTYGGAAENPDPNFTDASAWNYGAAPNIVTITDGVAGQFALRFAPNPGTGNYSHKFAVDINKPYILRALYRKVSGADGTIYLRAHHYTAADVGLGYSDHSIAPGGVLTTFQQFTSPLLVLTAGTAFVRLEAIGNVSGTVGFHDIQAFRLDEQIGAGLIKDNAVTRPAIKVDAISDTVRGAIIGPVDIPLPPYTFMTIATGLIGPHELWRAGVSIEYKHNSGAAAILAFEKRFKYAGVWGAWIESNTLTTTLAWDTDGSSAGFSGQYDDAEFRLIVKTNAGVRVNSAKNIRLTATNVVR